MIPEAGGTDEERFEHTHASLKPGTLCHTTYREQVIPYLFGGWRSNTGGRFAVFYRVQTGEQARPGWGMETGLIYNATFTVTLLRKFPDLPEECTP